MDTLANLNVQPGDVVKYDHRDVYEVARYGYLYYLGIDPEKKTPIKYSHWSNAPFFTIVRRKHVKSIEELL